MNNKTKRILKKNILSILILLVLIVTAILISVFVINSDKYELSPIKKADGSKWVIGYYEGGQYVDYFFHIIAFINGLIEDGWIEKIDLTHFYDSTSEEAIWNFLSENVKSNYLEFPRDAFWSINWEENERSNFLNDFLEKKDSIQIDLMIAMGTWAGQDLVIENNQIPTIVMSSSDPLEAGIVKGEKYSGISNIFAVIDPNRFKKAIEFFYDLFKFEKLGVAYENNKDADVYSNISILNDAAKEYGFELVECYADDIGLTDEECKNEISKCYEKLAPNIDALWIGVHRGENFLFMPEILKPMFDNKIPTLYLEGSQGVKRGVLISMGGMNFNKFSNWISKVFTKILHGEIPGNINQVFEYEHMIDINMETARRIGYEPPEAILGIAENAYEEIEGDE